MSTAAWDNDDDDAGYAYEYEEPEHDDCHFCGTCTSECGLCKSEFEWNDATF